MISHLYEKKYSTKNPRVVVKPPPPTFRTCNVITKCIPKQNKSEGQRHTFGAQGTELYSVLYLGLSSCHNLINCGLDNGCRTQVNISTGGGRCT